jgi:hypothetical protein
MRAMEWLLKNKEWVFSGVGVFVVGLAIAALAHFFRRRTPSERLAASQIRQQQHASRARFRWSDGSTDHVSMTYNFFNEGGPVSSVSIRTEPPIQSQISPSTHILQHGRGFVRFASSQPRLPFPIEFQILYTTQLGERLMSAFVLADADREPHLVNET